MILQFMVDSQKEIHMFAVLTVFISVVCVAIFDTHHIKLHGWYIYKNREANPEILDMKREVEKLKLE